ncbi:transcription cofactor vestigial-like protein 4 isoform 1-T1 [Geothlypis trichas]
MALFSREFNITTVVYSRAIEKQISTRILCGAGAAASVLSVRGALGAARPGPGPSCPSSCPSSCPLSLLPWLLLELPSSRAPSWAPYFPGCLPFSFHVSLLLPFPLPPALLLPLLLPCPTLALLPPLLLPCLLPALLLPLLLPCPTLALLPPLLFPCPTPALLLLLPVSSCSPPSLSPSLVPSRSPPSLPPSLPPSFPPSSPLSRSLCPFPSLLPLSPVPSPVSLLPLPVPPVPQPRHTKAALSRPPRRPKSPQRCPFRRNGLCDSAGTILFVPCAEYGSLEAGVWGLGIFPSFPFALVALGLR